ncbi:DNA repair protein rhp57 [Coemansia sp. RSA 2599]|nr:DNA repair protein rhp57 [Coemansia sp. RSA 2599]
MGSISVEDQALLDKCKSKLGCDEYFQCLLVPSAELQRAAGLSEEQAHRVRHLLSRTTYPWRSKIAAASELGSQDEFITTGDERIDGCFGGGIRQQSITEIVGESASGKTQLCLQLAVSSLLESSDNRVVYISTEGAFPTGRLASMLAARCSETAVQRAMERVQVAEFDDMETMFHAMEYKLPALMGSGVVRLVVVDSIAAHLRFGADEATGQMGFYKRRSAQLVSLGAKLKLWATEYRCAIVCTNQVKDVVDDGDARPPLGGSLLPSASSVEGSVEGDGGFSALAVSRKAPALGSVWANIIDARIMMYQRRGLALSEFQRPENPADSAVHPPGHLMRTRRWLENAFSPWAPHAQCEVFLDASGFHHI